jgi:hypothetical protein
MCIKLRDTNVISYEVVRRHIFINRCTVLVQSGTINDQHAHWQPLWQPLSFVNMGHVIVS